MPNMSGHMAVAKKVSEMLNITDKDFYKGNLLPDLYKDKAKSHYKIQGTKYLVPDIETVIKVKDLNKALDLGYLTHLLLDFHYLEDFLTPKYEENVFIGKNLYNDYDILNKDIVKHFNLDKEYIKSAMKDFDNDIEPSKLDLNIRCLEFEKDGETYYLDKDDYIKFLEDASITIAEELKKYLK